MKYRLFTIASALSLVLCVATSAEWIRSYWVHDVFERCRTLIDGDRETVKILSGSISVNARCYDVEFSEGKANYMAAYCEFAKGEPIPNWWRYTIEGDISDIDEGFHGFSFHMHEYERYMATIPLWLIVCVFACFPAMWLPGILRRIHRRKGVCNTCGYDLRATPDRCPECGTKRMKALGEPG